ncbi:MAG: OsmC family protein [Calditrichia bacterium]|nr:OsmC family protein [Calditrichia bacterium]
MSKFSIKLQEDGSCIINHKQNQSSIITDSPPEYGGMGRSFSSTDLVAAALGSCILTTIDKIIIREGFDPTKIEIKVEKYLSNSPKMIKAIKVAIFHPGNYSNNLIDKLKKAAVLCPVKRSLKERVNVSIDFLAEQRK